MIKKSFVILIAMVILMICQPENLAAKSAPDMVRLNYGVEDGEFISDGYTEEGVYYEVYGTKAITRALEGIFVTRTVIFEGVVQPESTMYWKEYINGDAYSGTLSLVKYNCAEGHTMAIYEGTLRKKIE